MLFQKMKNETIIVIMNPISHIRIILLLLLLVLASFVGTTATSERVVVTSGRVVYEQIYNNGHHKKIIWLTEYGEKKRVMDVLDYNSLTTHF